MDDLDFLDDLDLDPLDNVVDLPDLDVVDPLPSPLLASLPDLAEEVLVPLHSLFDLALDDDEPVLPEEVLPLLDFIDLAEVSLLEAPVPLLDFVLPPLLPLHDFEGPESELLLLLLLLLDETDGAQAVAVSQSSDNLRWL